MGERFFSKKHIWVQMDGNVALLGISDYAQKKLGSIMFLNLPEEGEHLLCGQRFGDIESVKAVSDLISPLDGEVVKVNEELVDATDFINDKPYESWFVEVRMNTEPDELMDEETYLKLKEEL